MSKTHTVRIERIADRGMALARIEGGKVLFIPFAAPGDLARITVTKEKCSHALGRIETLIEPSPHRVEPRCPLFGQCGGCAWQHLAYPVQMQGKADSFAGFFHSRPGFSDLPIGPTIPSASPYGYRNRVTLQVASCGGRVRAGFARARTHDLLAVTRCPVCHPALEALLVPLDEALAPLGRENAPTRILFQRDDAGALFGVYAFDRPPAREERARWAQFAAETGLAALYATARGAMECLAGEAQRRMRFFPAERFELGVTPGGFVQANPSVSRALVAEVTATAKRFAGGSFLDLYAGSGNFTLPLAKSAARVVAVESYGPAADDAARNAKALGLPFVEVRHAPVEEALAALAARGERASFCLLDPPRNGAADALPHLLALAPDAVAYVSCSPPTLARDLASFVAAGYRVLSLSMADMFPQTAHAEAVALLVRGDSLTGGSPGA